MKNGLKKFICCFPVCFMPSFCPWFPAGLFVSRLFVLSVSTSHTHTSRSHVFSSGQKRNAHPLHSTPPAHTQSLEPAKKKKKKKKRQRNDPDMMGWPPDGMDWDRKLGWQMDISFFTLATHARNATDARYAHLFTPNLPYFLHYLLS